MAKSPSPKPADPSAKEPSPFESISFYTSIEPGTWQHDLSNGEMIWSDRLYRIFGLEPDSVRPSQKIVESLVHPEDRERVFAEYNIAIKEKQALKTSCRLLFPNGEIRIVQALG
jgi:PAS domain-containing protein